MLPAVVAVMGKPRVSRMKRQCPWTRNSPGPTCQVSRCLSPPPSLPASWESSTRPCFLGQLGALWAIPAHPSPICSSMIGCSPCPAPPTKPKQLTVLQDLILDTDKLSIVDSSLNQDFLSWGWKHVNQVFWRGKKQKVKSTNGRIGCTYGTNAIEQGDLFVNLK